MAGAGFKTFTAGAILGASEVNTYLMQQTLMVFANSTARDAALAAPTEGMHVYLNDTGVVWAFDGTYWQPITPASRESGTASATLVSGSPWSTQTGSVTFTANRFSATQPNPIVNATATVSSSAQATVQIYSITSSGFSYRVSLYASSTATLSINWMATQS
jgi:hypothetical protein